MRLGTRREYAPEKRESRGGCGGGGKTVSSLYSAAYDGLAKKEDIIENKGRKVFIYMKEPDNI